MSKESTRKAFEKYLIKNDPTLKKKRKKRNGSPEKEVEKEVTAWLKKNNFSFNVMEAKSTFSAKAGRYISQSVTPGVSDIVGNDPNGAACFIELKAPGKLKSLRPNQYLFLKDKILKNCFAVVVDSAMLLEQLYHQWLNAEVGEGRIGILNQHLLKLKPSILLDDDSDLFE